MMASALIPTEIINNKSIVPEPELVEDNEA